MAMASSETNGHGEQRGLCWEVAQSRLEKKSRTTTEVQSLLSGKPSHSPLLYTPFSLFSSPIPRRNGCGLPLLTMA